ncbi:MAG: ABC transporter ATP-binding protein [Rhodobacteraceae bacterium]|nr:ABC transporter ATP-binding protein [Paracoccaceae bacterium]
MIALDRFSVRFGTSAALREATISVAPGDRLGVVGESGSGKTMLGLAMMGMTPGQGRLEGSLSVDGREMADAPEPRWQALRARRVAMIFQEPMSALNPLRRIGDLICEPLGVHMGMGRRAARARAADLLAEVGLPDPALRLRQFPHELSGGQRQRALIALALACDPAFLIADEPTTALDAHVAQRVTALLVRLAEARGMGLILISHDLTTIARATTRIAVMYGGDIVETGPTRAVLSDPAHPYTLGLLAARPAGIAAARPPGAPRPRLATIPGSVPRLADLPEGCRFAGRCAIERAICATRRPVLRPAGPGAAACHALEGGQ